MTLNPLLPMESLIVLLAVILAGGLLLAWRASVRLPPRAKWAALGARALALFALAAIALNWGYWRKPQTENKPRWCLLLDRSASMATADVAGGSRWEAARRLASQVQGVTTRDVDLFTFSAGVDGARQTAKSLEALTPDGRGTDLGRALEAMTGSGAAGVAPLAGFVVLTDGRQTTLQADPVLAGLRARALDAPVLAVPLGTTREVRDLSVRATRSLAIGFVGQPVRIRADVQTRWSGAVNVPVRLLDDSERVVATNEIHLPAVGRGSVSFTVTPTQPGFRTYKLQVAPWEGETDLRNNESVFEVNALDRKIRVLLVEGVPYWDSKFLGQHLRKQANMAVTAVYRTAPGRFFTTDPSGAPVAEGRPIFPESAEELGAYDLVVLGKGSEYVLTPARLAALKRFVADQGGSLVFARGKPYAEQGDGLEELEPVEWGGAAAVECRLLPRAEGEDVGLFAGLLPGREDGVWSRLPAIKSSQAVAGIKSFAQVLAEGRRPGAAETGAPTVPLLVSRRFGKGMTATMNVDGLWQWSFFPSSKEAATMYEEMWTQLLLWVGTYAEFLPGHEYALHLSASSAWPNMPVRVQVRRRGPMATGGSSAELRVRVMRGTTIVQELVVMADEKTDRWETSLALSEPGLYRVILLPPVGAEKLGHAPGILFQVQAPPAEADDLNPDQEYLQQVAEASGGRVLPAEALAEAMTQREQTRQQQVNQGGNQVWEPLWDRAWLLVLVIAACAVEWTIRRRHGLA